MNKGTRRFRLIVLSAYNDLTHAYYLSLPEQNKAISTSPEGRPVVFKVGFVYCYNGARTCMNL